MVNLSQLKGKQDYRGIRITEDYTPAGVDTGHERGSKANEQYEIQNITYIHNSFRN